MKDLITTTSQFIEQQFPAVFRSDGEELVAFIKAYYEFLESNDTYSTKLSREIFDTNDIDESLNKFIVHFKEKYLKDFPYVTATDKRFMVKHIMDFYRSKGSPRSLELLMKLLYNEESDVYYPGKDIFRASNSRWNEPKYIEVSESADIASFVNSQIVGSISKSKAFVEAIIKKRVNGKIVTILYLSKIEGSFVSGERVTNGSDLTTAPVVLGSLSDITITLGGQDNKVGDVFDVVSNQGQNGKIRITGIENSTGLVNFTIVDEGFGYTTDATTKIYVSDAVLFANNANESFIEFEKVVQPLETITTLSSLDINATASPGDYIVGIDSSNTVVANGTIMSIANTDSNGSIITANSANSKIVVSMNTGTFNTQYSIDLATPTTFSVGEVVEEENYVTLTLSGITGTFSNGEIVEQITRDPVSNTITAYAFGTINGITNTSIDLVQSWGDFTTSSTVTGKNSGAYGTVSNISVTMPGARGTVTTNSDANTIIVDDIFGAFNANNQIRGNKSHLIATMTNISDAGASIVWLNANSAANGVIDLVANSYATGIIVGQNTTAIGVYGNTNPFFYTNATPTIVETRRSELISPPRDANGTIVEVNLEISNISTGDGANFKVGYLENKESVTLNTDIVGANNIIGQPYTDIKLTGENSGVGFVNSVTINDGGTQYTNGTIVTFSGGGYGAGDPYVSAEGTIATDANGTITAITVTTPGEGYWTTPIIDIGNTAGLTANVSVVMDYGYGLPILPNGDLTNLIGDVLTYDTFEIGKIASLTSINPGQNYNVDPFVHVINPYISTFNRRDFIIEVTNLNGAFKIGEYVEQVVNTSVTAKGTVLSANLTHISIERNSFNVGFIDGIQITGATSGATASIVGVQPLLTRNPAGDNADITAKAISANGIATTVDIIDSGYGYITGEEVTLSNSNNVFVMTGTSSATTQGKSQGYWTDTTSMPDSDSKIRDGLYYQEFSYDVISGLSLDKYKNIVNRTLHMAGTKLFGSVSKTLVANSELTLAESSVTQGTLTSTLTLDFANQIYTLGA